MSSFLSDPPNLYVRELTGDRHVLELSGRALPYRPISFEGAMRAEFSWYPGSPQASVQVLGAEEKGTTINGKWKDRFLRVESLFGVGFAGGSAIATLDGNRIADVRSLVKAVDAFRRRGQLVELSWGDVIRVGLLRRFRQTWLRTGDVEWEMEFEWAAQEDTFLPIMFGPDFNLADVYNAVNDAVQAVKDVVDAVFAIVDGVKNAISGALALIEGAVAAIGDAVEKAAGAILSPLEAAKIVLASVQTVKEQAQSIRDTLESFPARAIRTAADVRASARRLVGAEEDAAQSTTTSGAATGSTGGAGGTSGAGGSDVVQGARVAAARAEAAAARSQGIDGIAHEEVLESEQYKRRVRAAARQLRAVAADQEQLLTARTVRVPDVQSYSVRADQDLRDVSIRFYGTQEEWKRLLIYNNLATSRLEAGQIVLVPPLSTLRGS